MDILLKGLCFLLLGIGAFLVYGARFVAERIDKDKKNDAATGNNLTDHAVQPIYEESLQDEDEGTKPNHSKTKPIPNKSVLNIKMAGMVFVLAGGILALIAFR